MPTASFQDIVPSQGTASYQDIVAEPSPAGVPDPAQVDQHTSLNSQILMAAANQEQGVPGVPGGVPPAGPPFHVYTPYGLRTPSQDRGTPAGGIPPNQQEGALAEFLKVPFVGTGIGSIATGMGEMGKPGLTNKAGGAADVLGGAMDIGTVALPGGLAKAPAHTLLTLGAGAISAETAHQILKLTHVPKEWDALGSALAGLMGGGWALRKLTALAKLSEIPEANVYADKLWNLATQAAQATGRAKDAVLAQIDGITDRLRGLETNKKPSGAAGLAQPIEKEKKNATTPSSGPGQTQEKSQSGQPAQSVTTTGPQLSQQPRPAAEPSSAPAPQAQTPSVNGPSDTGNPRSGPLQSEGSERPGGTQTLPQGNESGGVRRSGETTSTPGNGQSQSDTGSKGQSVRRVTGSVDKPLTDKGREQARALQARIPADVKVFAAPNSRSTETAGPNAQKAEWLAPVAMGDHEGQPLEKANATINDQWRNRPDEKPGTSSHSGVEGESFNQAAARISQGVRQQAASLKPGDKVLNVTSGRVLEFVDAMRPDGTVDVAKVTGGQSEFSKPGQIYHQTPSGLVPVDSPQPGQNWTTHGETEWNQAAPEAGNKPSVTGAPLPDTRSEPQGQHRTDIGTVGSEQPPPTTGASLPPPTPHESSASSVTFGSGLGGLEPLFREAKAEGDRLRAIRNAAIKAARAAEGTPQEKQTGEALRSYFTGERDLWAARANQAIDIVKRKVLSKIQDREALTIMREFRHKPGELQAFLDGSHPYLQQADGGVGQAMKRLDKIRPLMQQALRMIVSPTTREATADKVLTNISQKSLDEGRAGGWLESRWQPDEYVPHLINPKGQGELAKLPEAVRRRQGKIGKHFQFSERRQDEYPTYVHAIADGLTPKTLDPAAAFTIHADNFARARATHLLGAEMANLGLGVWTNKDHAPDGWVPFAAHSDEWVRHRAFEMADPTYQAGIPPTGAVSQQKLQRIANLNRAGVPAQAAMQTALSTQLGVDTDRLYVPEFVDNALDSVTAPEQRSEGFAKVRNLQRGLKEAILGLSGFHLLTENMMAAADIGPKGMLEAFKAKRGTRAFLENERDLIRSGGTTSIQGSVMDAYRGLQPGTIPTRGDIIKAYLGYKLGPEQTARAITEFTFDNIQRRFKVVSFQMHRDAWLRDNPLATPEQFEEAKKGIASYVNGVYGGLHWENMGISRMAVDVSRFFFLAPDWSFSNVALGKYAADAKLSARELPLGKKLAGATTKESAQARLSRAFWAKQIVGGLVATQMLSLMFSGKLSPRPFQVYLGKDKDGRDVYQNLVFRGSAGDLVNLASKMEDHGLLTGAGVFIGGKFAPVTKAGMHMLTGLDDLGHQIAPKGLNPIANTVRGIGTAVTDVSPIPLTMRNIGRQIEDPSGNYLWSERILNMFGPQAQHVTPQGYRMTPDGLEEKEPEERTPASTWDQIRTGKPFEKATQ